VREVRQFTIGALAARAAVSKHTILYYERSGLLPKGRRSLSGYRLFSTEAARRIAFIKRAQRLGFTLNEIRELIALRVRGATCEGVHQRILAKIAQIDATLRALRNTRRKLATWVEECPSGRPLNECAVLQHLEGEADDDALDDGRTAE
jgi:DNA-binding transcriptional MerR regulator